MKWEIGDEFFVIDSTKDSLGFDEEDLKRVYKAALIEYDDDKCNKPGKNLSDYIWFKPDYEWADSFYYISKSNIKPASKLHRALK